MMGVFRFMRFSILSGLLAAAIGMAVLIGWATDNPFLKAVNPDFFTMKPNTALCLILLGLALLLHQSFPGSRKIGLTMRLLALLVAAIGLLSLSQYVVGVDWGIDQFLFSDAPNAVRTTYLGRMAPTAAVTFTLLGMALLLSGSRFGPKAAQVGCTIGSAISLFVLVGYAYQVDWLTGVAAYTPMAVHTATAFLFLSLGILGLHPDHGIVGLLRRPTSGGLMLRFMLPIAIMLPLVFGWLRLVGEMAGLYSTRFGTSMFALTMTVAFVACLLWIAVSMNRLDERRRRATEEFDRFFSVSLDLLCIAGTDGMFKRINQAWARTLGYSTEELLSTPYLDFVHPEDREPTIAAALKLTEGSDVTSFENRYRKRDGSYVWLNWVCRAPDQENGPIFAIARDLTERKLHEEQMRRLNAELEERNREAREANRELESFSYSVSHDLRAPLRSIDGFSQALLEDCADQVNEEGKTYLDRVRKSAQQMAELIDDLLALSRVSRGEFQRQRVDLTNIARTVLARLTRERPDRAVDLAIPDEVIAVGDARLLGIVLENLLGNAWKFTSKRVGARIEFGHRLESGRKVYFVSDNGAGFDMAYVQKLFGVFQRLHSASEFEGTGIGLVTVQRIIHRHGGRVWAEGAVDCGATFYFTLAPTDGKGESDEGQDNLTGGGQPRRCDVDSARVEAEQNHQ